jgi:hypothetical protein
MSPHPFIISSLVNLTQIFLYSGFRGSLERFAPLFLAVATLALMNFIYFRLRGVVRALQRELEAQRAASTEPQ